DVRLPQSLIPDTYSVLIHPDFKNFTFSGWSNIEVVASEETDYIIMHAKNLSISNVSVTVPRSKLTVTNCKIYENLEQLQIKLDTSIMKHDTVVINVSFSGVLRDDMLGFYKSSYTNKKNNVVRYLSATQFQPTEARSAFPCFDEPHMKATFKFYIIRPNDYISLFNTKLNSSWITTGTETCDSFVATRKMSTYMLAFVVCDFSSKSQMIKSGVNVIYTQPDTFKEMDLALNTTIRSLHYFEKLFGMSYLYEKLDTIALPEMYTDGLGSRGLITYHSNYIFFNEDEKSDQEKSYLVSLVAREVAHQWFGNLVMLEWWDDLLLNEGFITYVVFGVFKEIIPEWPTAEAFSFDVVASAMAENSFDSSSYSVVNPVTDPRNLNVFEKKAFYKICNVAASLFQMLENVIGTDVFNKAIHDYLVKHMFATSNRNNLWLAFSKQVPTDGHSINVPEMMETWTHQIGLPLVTVIRDGRHVTCHQERFFVRNIQVRPTHLT
ncbi:hypothetical protein HELRODRAFT_119961, partial [Helobdella robusta]|uniref:Uncharacterized protein n=1 Tax=Helobdella robusta TaxID=6412 RepID=T1EGP1_HELRO